MAKLPGEEDLGRVARVSGDRAIGFADASGLERAAASEAAGAAAMAQGANNLGKGISSLGEDIGAVAKLESSFEYSRAHSDYLTKETALRTELANDRDYPTLTKRYEERSTKLRDDSAALITSPYERDRFLQNTKLSIAQGVEGMTGRASKMAADANGAWVAQTNNTLIDQATAIDDPLERAKYIDAGIANIDGRLARGEIGPTEALQAKQAFAHQYALADGIVRSQRDPQGVLNELQAQPGSGDAVTNRILQVEGFGKNGKSSASGAGQFVDATWLDVLKRNRPDLAEGRSDDELLALKADKTLGRQMTDIYRQENVAYLQKQGIQPTAGNQYLAHFLGPAGAAAMIKADPKMPAIDALTEVVGEKKAQAMVDANPTILNSLAGNVRQWADGKMGGAGAHDAIYSFLPPAMRAQLAQHAQEQMDKQTATDTSAFVTRREDTLAEAARNGSAQQPMTQGEFVAALGAKKGLDAYSDYQADMKLRSDVGQVSKLTPQQQDDLVKSYDPKPGEEGFADQAKRQAALQKAIETAREQRNVKFASRITDHLAEASRTGSVTEPATKEEFIDALGRDAGMTAFQNYSDELRAKRDVRNVPPAAAAQNELVASYDVPPGAPDYAAAAKRQAEVAKAVMQVRKERDEDPAQFAITRIPSVQDAWQTFAKIQADGAAGLADKQAAARDFVNKTTLEQQKAGVAPTDIRVLPKGYTESLKARLDSPQEAGGTDNVVKQIKNEASLWGTNWPAVYRQIAPEVSPLVRVIGSGVSDQAGRILTELAPQKLSDILKDESTDKSNQVKKDVLTAFTPFIKSMAGNEGGIGLFNDFRSQGEKLSAYYIVNGMNSADASQKAFKELIGDRYDFKDSWRMPKGLAQSADDVQRGTVQAMRDLEAIGITPPRDTIGGLSSDYLVKAKADAIRRDGKWVTAPDESGLALVYNDEAVRRADGKPLVMSWSQLGTIAERARREGAGMADVGADTMDWARP
jgi:hypothetical protein